ncbi:DUF6880 family protein [Roseomonas populi]|uniref:Uncharacterized protein n=1 Tax=Roseomonas populi TaxID=3121582 RepID=A0ABT1X9R9_9PROT|nr:DUF6880 family protein [Roseomonas pecuniae]MCR0984847.1 hypothetical protein [Roseomonas pecuniae]
MDDDPRPRGKRGTATGRTLNAANLEALGTARLAELLMAISKGNAAAQRQLRLALAGSSGTEETARAVTKQLVRIGRAKTWLDWQKIKPLLAELEVQRRAILDVVAPVNPAEAFELLWRLVGCGEGVLARSDDGSGRLIDAFRTAARDLGPLAQRAGLPPEALANRTFQALAGDEHGVWDELIPTLASQLGTTGLQLVRDAVQAWRAEPATPSPASKPQVVAWSGSGPIHAGEAQSRLRKRTASLMLQRIADALGDVDGFIQQFDAPSRTIPAIAAAIARRLLGAGRLPEAWAALEGVDARNRKHAPVEWEEARVDVLEALGRSDEAQTFRWACFAATLNATHLRAYLRKLPGFEDVEAEERALDHALTFKDVHRSLEFLVSWPDLRRASELVLGRAPALDGDLYELLSPAADALEGRYPLAATLLRRAIIGFTLSASRSSRYKHAARHFRSCRDTAVYVENFGSVPDHSAYERALRTTHGRKFGFWQEVDKLA